MDGTIEEATSIKTNVRKRSPREEWVEHWHASDYSWRGGLTKSALDSHAIDIPPDFPKRGVQYLPEQRITLRDYWRWSIGLPGPNRIMNDDEMQKLGLLQEVGGKTFHLVHLPSFGSKRAQSAKNFELLDAILLARCRPNIASIESQSATLHLNGAWLPEVFFEKALQAKEVVAERTIWESIRAIGLETRSSIDLTNACIVGRVALGNAKFYGRFFATGARFCDAVELGQATFHSVVSFEGAEFYNRARFDRVTFDHQSNFIGARFFGRSVFTGAKFPQGAIFDECTFESFAIYLRAEFEGVVSFDMAQFRHVVNFRSCKFKKTVHMSEVTFDGTSSFAAAEFNGETNLFDESVFNGVAEFSRTTFDGEVSFDSVSFDESFNFASAVFLKSTSFRGVVWPNSLTSNSFQKARFLGRAEFSNSAFLPVSAFNNAYFETQAVFGTPTAGHQSSFKRFCKSIDDFVPEPDSSVIIHWDALAGGYRQLKLNAAYWGDHELKQKFYTYEVRARVRSPSTSWSEKAAANVYGACSDYGNSIIRPLISLISLIAVFALAFWCLSRSINLIDPNDPSILRRSIWESIQFSWNNVFNPFSALSLEYPTSDDLLSLDKSLVHESGGAISTVVQMMATFQSIAGVVLGFLFALAVRRRFQMN